MTPFKALYGKEPPNLLRGERDSIVEEVQVLIEERNRLLDGLKFQLEGAHNRMKVYADQKRKEVAYEVGDRVYLKLQPYILELG